MLLHHTSGLDDYTGTPFLQAVLADPSYRWTQQTILEFAATHGKPVGAPGDSFHCSSTGYTYLGLVIENVTGVDLAESIRRLDRLDDLNMPSTYWEILEPTPDDILPLTGQYYDTIDMTKLDASYDLYGGGGLDSNSRDLC
jgi:D-alanyl-D-alanine carboxypeptidase